MSTTVINTFCDDALGNSDAVEVAQKIKNKDISVLEAIEAAIARAKAANPALNAIVTDTFETAKSQAQRPSEGVFAGVPTFVKDNSDIQGVPTLHGTRALKPVPKKKTGQFVNQLLSTGLISLGKSTLPEFGIPPTTESLSHGHSCNPWNIRHSTGGSSGGSAALVAAGVVPIAHANDGGGSTRIPAACCGLVGLKPTRNRLVSKDGTDSLPINVVFDGIVSRSVRDTAHFIYGAECHYQNKSLPMVGLVETPNKKRLKIGVVTQAIAGIQLHPDVLSTINATAKLSESLGHTIEEVPLPFTDQLGEDFLDYYGFLFFMIHRFGKKIFEQEFDNRQLEELAYAFSRRFAKRMLKFPFVLQRLRNTIKVTEKLFAHYDVIMCPTTSSPAIKNGLMTNPAIPGDIQMTQMRNFAPFAALQNITGEPAISLPMGSSEDNLPIGIQFTAGFGQDKLLLELAFELEEAQPWKHLYSS